MASDSIRELDGRAGAGWTQEVSIPSLPDRPPWSRSTDESEKAMGYIERNMTANVLTCCYAAL